MLEVYKELHQQDVNKAPASHTRELERETLCSFLKYHQKDIKSQRRKTRFIDSEVERVKQKMIMITSVVRQMMTIVQDKVIVVFA